MILLEICEPSVELLKSALTHDLAESETGDIPATAKWASSDLGWALEKLEFEYNKRFEVNFTLSPHEQECLKWADMLELIMYCQTEVSMGNLKMEGIVRTGITYLDARNPPTLLASAFLELLK
jgi:5'-deoxynucleotidase YfbR-like HD superfamily hydrolase